MDRSPPPAVEERWSELLDDAEATAAEYEEAGWETLVVHAGDVTPLEGDPFGLAALAPGDEFEALEALVEDVTFDTSHVYRTEEGDARLFLIVVEGTPTERGDDDDDDDDDDGGDGGDGSDDGDGGTADRGGVAVVVPAFLAISQSAALEARATEAGVMYTHVRPLSDDARVTFAHEEPELFF